MPWCLQGLAQQLLAGLQVVAPLMLHFPVMWHTLDRLMNLVDKVFVNRVRQVNRCKQMEDSRCRWPASTRHQVRTSALASVALSAAMALASSVYVCMGGGGHTMTVDQQGA